MMRLDAHAKGRRKRCDRTMDESHDTVVDTLEGGGRVMPWVLCLAGSRAVTEPAMPLAPLDLPVVVHTHVSPTQSYFY